MHLNPGRSDGHPEIGAPPLDHRDQQIGPALRMEPLGRIGKMPAAVDHCRGVIGECAHRLGGGAHPQQHPAHIRVMDDRRRTAIDAGPGSRTRGDAERPALHPGAGEVARLLIGPLGDRQTLHPDIEPGIVHHREHQFETAVFLADAPADRVLIGEHAGRRGMDAELVFEAQGLDPVARTEGVVLARQKFRRQEQRQPPASRRSVGAARQHHMDDVRGEVMVAVGDEDLLAGDPVMLAPFRVVCRDRAGAQRAEIRPGLRLGQVHRPGPFAGDQPAEIARLLLGRAIGLQHFDRGHVEQRAQREAHAGRAPHLGHRHREGERQTLPAIFGIGGEPVPAALDMAPIGLAKPRRGPHHAVFEDAADPVARSVQRRQHRFGEPRRLAQDRFDHVGVGGLAARRSRGRLQRKAHIGERRGIGHGTIPPAGAPECSRPPARSEPPLTGMAWSEAGLRVPHPLSRKEEGDCGGLLSVERSRTADERIAPQIKSQQAVRIPRDADPDAPCDFAGFAVTSSEP